MPIRFPPRLLPLGLVVAMTLPVGGCASLDALDVRAVASHLPPYQVAEDAQRTTIDHALDECGDKTEEQEATCVKDRLEARDTSLKALEAMVPGCHVGKTCVYHHVSRDRLGYVKAIDEIYEVRWKVTFGENHDAKKAADLPITVEQE